MDSRENSMWWTEERTQGNLGNFVERVKQRNVALAGEEYASKSLLFV